MSKDIKKKLRYEMDKWKRLGGKYRQLELIDSKKEKEKEKNKKPLNKKET